MKIGFSMKSFYLAIVFSGLVLYIQADAPGNEICVKEIWEPGEAVAPSSVDDDDDDDEQDASDNAWPNRPYKPQVDDADGPSMFQPKSEKDIFYPEQ
jgi:hypothetical protein